MNHETPEALLAGRRSGDGPAPTARRPGIKAWLAAGVAAIVLGGGIYIGIHERAVAEAALATDTTEAAVQTVDVISPKSDAPDEQLVLPGQTSAFTDTPIYARTSGYLKAWHFDIGAHVKHGDLLAEIETPELDQQLRQARAQLARARAALQQSDASMELAKVTNGRSAVLVRQGWTSQQQGDQDRLNFAGRAAGVSAARADLQAQQAQVDRLEQLAGFEHVVAPFDGVITARRTDVGALINAGAGGPATELFHMTATQTLRVFVAVPETYAPSMHIGATPSVTLDEYPGETFHGTLVRTDATINSMSRTLTVEIDVDNAAGKLLPGAYTYVHFTLPGRARAMTIPANTLLFRAEGLRVAVVRDGVTHLVPITIGRDYGNEVEVLSGVGPTDQVIVNPSDSLMSGTTVRLGTDTNAKTS